MNAISPVRINAGMKTIALYTPPYSSKSSSRTFLSISIPLVAKHITAVIRAVERAIAITVPAVRLLFLVS